MFSLSFCPVYDRLLMLRSIVFYNYDRLSVYGFQEVLFMNKVDVKLSLDLEVFEYMKSSYPGKLSSITNDFWRSMMLSGNDMKENEINELKEDRKNAEKEINTLAISLSKINTKIYACEKKQAMKKKEDKISEEREQRISDKEDKIYREALLK